jgi:ATP-dependent helicase/nuclease subunit A
VEYEWRAEPTAATAHARAPAEAADEDLPRWVISSAPPPPPALRRLTPSTALGGTTPPQAPFTARNGTTAAAAIERGLFVHRMLQSLPEVPEAQCAGVGARYLDAVATKWADAEKSALLAEVLAIMSDPAFAEAFAPGSRAEVEIAGRLGGVVISGRIDRLAVTAARVLIVDFKTNRPPPATLEKVPEAYIGQLAVYRAVLSRLYPGRAISAALLWTDSPSLMVIPEDRLILAESQISAP